MYYVLWFTTVKTTRFTAQIALLATLVSLAIYSAGDAGAAQSAATGTTNPGVADSKLRIVPSSPYETKLVVTKHRIILATNAVTCMPDTVTCPAYRSGH